MADCMFLLKRLFDATQTKAAISIKIKALKLLEPEATLSINIPLKRPTAAAFETEEKSENATKSGNTNIGVAV